MEGNNSEMVVKYKSFARRCPNDCIQEMIHSNNFSFEVYTARAISIPTILKMDLVSANVRAGIGHIG